jgi:O-antigen/teichoic acid export membrane protein
MTVHENVDATMPFVCRTLDQGLFVVLAIALTPPRRLSFSCTVAREVLAYALPASFAVLCLTVFANVDKLQLSHLLDMATVGIYSAAFWLTYFMISRVSEATLAVLFKTAASASDLSGLAVQLLKATPLLLLTIFPAILVFASMVAKLLGERFRLPLLPLAIFSFGASAYFTAHLHWWVWTSTGSRGAGAFSIHALLATLILLCVNQFTIPTHGLLGAAAGLSLGTAYLLASGIRYTLLLSRRESILPVK